MPIAGRDPVPAWVLLHGITVKGRHHEAVRRMARSLAAAGHLAVVPETPAWTDLQVAPDETERAVRAGLELVHRWPVRRVGVMAFSVVAPWALAAVAGKPRRGVDGIASFGGYADIRRLIRAMIIGEHDWDGQTYRYTPDPYGRWILGAALLPLLPDDRYGPRAERETVARTLRMLARTAGLHGAAAFTPAYDDLIAACRQTLPPRAAAAFDLLAPPSARVIPERSEGLDLANQLADAAQGTQSALDPSEQQLRSLTIPVALMHGKADSLVPFTETLRLAAALPPGVCRDLTVTRLLGHTKTGEAERLRNPAALTAEAWRFVRAIRRMLRLVE